MYATIRLLTRATLAWAAVAVSVHSALAQTQYQYQGKLSVSSNAIVTPRIATDPDNNIYVTQYSSLSMFSPQGNFLRTLNTSNQVYGVTITGTAGNQLNYRTVASTHDRLQVHSPSNTSGIPSKTITLSATGYYFDVAVDSDDSILIAESNQIRRVHPTSGSFVQTFGSIGAATQQFGSSGIAGIDIDSAGNIWCSDPAKNRIVVFDKWGNYIKAVSDGTTQFKISDFDIASDGRIYAVNTARSTLEIYTDQGVYVTSVGQSGKPGEPTLSSPQSVAVDSAGRILVFSTTQGILIYVPRDLAPPVSTLTLTPDYAFNDWVNRAVTSTIRATDDFIGLGVSEIKYKVNGGSTVVPGNVASFTQAVEGLYTVEYSATDIVLNTEATKTFQFGIDYTPPVTSYLFSDDKRFLGLYADDALSGWDGTGYILDDGNAVSYDGPIYLDGGNHTLKYTSGDYAGNVESIRTLNISGSRVTALYVEPGTTVSEGPAKFRVVLDKPALGGAEVYIYFPELDIEDFIEIEPGKSEGTLIYDTVIPVKQAVSLKVWAFLGNDSFAENRLRIVPRIMTFTVNPRDLMPGGKGTGKVTIQYKNDNSPLYISCTNPNIVLPSSVNWVGRNSVAFQFRVLPNAPEGTAKITVRYMEQEESVEVSIGAYELVDAYIDPLELGYGGTGAMYAVLNAPAPPGGLTMNLTYGGALAKVPATLTVPGGETVGAVTIQAAKYSGPIWVEANYNNIQMIRAGGYVREPQVSDVLFTPDLVTGGVAAKGSVMLDGVAAYPTFVAISSSNMAVVKAVSVTVPKNKSSALLNFTTYPVGRPTAVTIQAGPKSTELTIMPVNVSLVKITTPTIRSGASSVVTVSLAKTAGVDTTVNLSTSTAGVVQIPATLTIPKGKSSVTFTATALTTSTRKTTSVQAETDGNIKSAGVTVNP